MSPYWVQLLISFILLITVNSTKGQVGQIVSPIYPTKQYTTLEGLPSNECYYSILDKEGYLWVSTDKGVSRFNGYEFENFTTADGLIDNTIFNLFLDSKGRVWFCGYNNEICYWENNEFHQYPYNHVITDFVRKREKHFNPIIDLYVSSSDEVSISIRSLGYLTINDQGNIVDTLDIDKYRKIIPSFDSISGVIHYLDTNEFHVNYFLPGYKTPKSSIHIIINQDSLIHITQAFQNQIFQNDAAHPVSRQNNGGLITRVSKENTFIYGYPDFGVRVQDGIKKAYLRKDETIKYWFEDKIIKANTEGVFIVDEDFKPVKKVSTLSIFEIVDLHCTNDNLWLTTRNKGLIYINIGDGVKNWPIDAFNTTGIVQHNDGIYVFSEKVINKMLGFKQDGNTWLSTRKRYEDFQVVNNNFYAAIPLLDNSRRLASCTYLIYEENKIFVAHRKVFYEINRTTGENIIYKCPSGIFSSCKYEGKVILGTQNGLFTFNNDSIIVPYLIGNLDLSEIRIQDIRTMDNTLIIGTKGNGVVLVKDNIVQQFTMNEGLASNIVNHLAIDNDKLWVATNNGVSIFKINDLDFKYLKTINLEDGIVSRDIRQIFITDSTAYLGGDNGVSVLSKLNIFEKKRDLPIHLQSITINDSLEYLLVDSNLSFPYYQNNFTFTFSSIAPELFRQPTYRYKLLGIDNDWVYTSERSIRYNSLPHGKYTFTVQVKNDFDSWSNTSPSYNFEIKKSYWTTTWFRIAAALGSIAILSSLFMFYIWNERKKNQLHQEINEVKQLSLNAQMNPHFVFNALNSIQNFVLNNEKDLAGKYLVKFAKLVRFIFKNSERGFIPMEEEFEALKIYVELEILRTQEKFKFKIEIDEAIDTKECLVPSLLIQPIIENAIWHGINHLNHQNGVILLKVQQEKDKLIFVVEDNGVGRKRANELKIKKLQPDHKSKGLIILQKRIKLLSSSKKIRYKYQIVDLNNEYGEALGTRVEFDIPFLLKHNEI